MKENYEDSTNIISRFTKETGFDFLSNFFPSTVRFDGKLYPTVEHAYQASKTNDEKIREIIRKAASPWEAKKLGRSIIIRSGWEEEKVKIMRDLIREKFHNPFLTHLLMRTNGARLVMDNKWNDRFWGVCRGSGENWLGRILMDVRDDINAELEEEKAYTEP